MGTDLGPDPDPYLLLTDPAPAPHIFTCNIFLYFFCLLFFEATFTSFFKDKKS
jgi:hypothetical protein